jgi:hypothetical protein
VKAWVAGASPIVSTARLNFSVLLACHPQKLRASEVVERLDRVLLSPDSAIAV